jgi:hypothetical protein
MIHHILQTTNNEDTQHPISHATHVVETISII